MTRQQYWVVGGDYADDRFDRMVPGTETIAGPYADERRAQKEWRRLTFSDHRCRSATTRYAIATGQTVLPELRA